MRLRLFLAGLPLALAIALTPALVIAADAARPALRGQARPQARAVSAAAPASRAATSPLAGLLARSTPGYAERARGGGAQCRQGCASELYICRVDSDDTDCNRIWSQCVAACPERSSGTY